MIRIMRNFINGLFWLAVFSVSFNCLAAPTLSVTPYQGNSFDFGRIDSKRPLNLQARIRVSGAEGIRYEVRQFLRDPLVNSANQRMLNTAALKTYTLRGSNAHGTLYQDIPQSLTTNMQVLYSSSPQGLDDNFILVCTLDPNQLSVNGEYSTKIVYQLMPLSGSPQPSTVILDLKFVVSDLAVEVITSSGNPQILELNSKDRLINGTVEFNVASVNEPYEIYQKLDPDPFKLAQAFKNKDGQELPDDFIRYMVTAKNGESLVVGKTFLNKQKNLIYVQHAGVDDKVKIEFSIDKDDLASVLASEYRVFLLYEIEAKGKIVSTIPLELAFVNQEDISMQISFDSPQGLTFSKLKPGTDPIERVVTFKVTSNMRKPYRIVQELPNALSPLDGGVAVEPQYFVLKGEVSGTSGEALYPNFTPVETGDKTVFVSDSKGNSSEFKLTYRLTAPHDTSAGSYSAKVTYRLLEK